MDSRIALRPAGPEDRAFLFRVYASSREAELALIPWNEEQKRVFLEGQFAAQDSWYREHYAAAAFDVIVAGGEPAGRLYVHRSEQGAGRGRRLLRDHRRGGAAGPPGGTADDARHRSGGGGPR